MTNRQRSKSGLPRTDEPDARTGAPSLQEKAHRLIPGGCHTYAKGDDQYPAIAPSFIVKGKGCHVWDLEGRNFIEYGMGLRSVTLGHAYEPVLAAVKDALEAGANFTRPAPIEVACAEALLDATKCGEQVKFSKDGSSVVTAAVKLARAYTGRDMVAACADHPFFSYDDWWIGTTSLDGGIPSAFPALTAKFRYNDIDGLRALFDRFGARIACVVLEPARTQEPEAGFLESVRDLCSSRGAVLIFDEMITGFRWSLGGGQESYGVKADLSTFGKAMANGFSVSALVGRRDIMDLGGAGNPGKKVFLLSTTHGAETHALAAALRTIQIYQEEPVIEHLYRQGRRLREGIESTISELRLTPYFGLVGRPCNLVYETRDQSGEPSQLFRSLFMQELIKGGVLAPSFVVSYAHDDGDIDRTIEVVSAALGVYRKALDEGAEGYILGPSVTPVFPGKVHRVPAPKESGR
jgi:glutamate-1-semialdehyde 2,1-aminomutase